MSINVIAIGIALFILILLIGFFRFSSRKLSLWVKNEDIRLQRIKEEERRLENEESQRQLDAYITGSLSGSEIGTLYERYIGYLFEIQGFYVEYNGALNGYQDLGRDLIVRGEEEILIVQTKRWANFKKIPENHIFQLYGSAIHFERSSNPNGKRVRAVFYTSATYSEKTKQVADVLGVELHCKDFDRTYPMIKCNVSVNGEKIYHLPFDPYYDKINIRKDEGNFYAYSVAEAAAKGFRRARNYKFAV